MSRFLETKFLEIIKNIRILLLSVLNNIKDSSS